MNSPVAEVPRAVAGQRWPSCGPPWTCSPAGTATPGRAPV